MHITRNRLKRWLIILITGVLLFKDILPANSDKILILLLLVVSIYVNGLRVKKNLGIIWITIYVVISVLICLVYGSNMSYALTISFSLFVMLALSSNIDNMDDMSFFLTVYAMIGTAFCLYLIVMYHQYLGLTRFANNHMLTDSKIDGSIELSYYLISISCAIIWSLYSKSKNYKFILDAGLVECFALILFSGVRKAILIPAVFYILLTLVKNKKNILKLAEYTILLIVIGFFVVKLIEFVPGLKRNLGTRLLFMFSSGVSSIKDDSSISSRMTLAQTGLQLFFQHPFGMGMEPTFDYFRNNCNGLSHPHNNYILMLDIGGVFYFTTYYWAHIYALQYFVKRRKILSDVELFFALYILLTLMSDFATSSYNIVFYNLFIGLGIFSIYLRRKEKFISTIKK